MGMRMAKTITCQKCQNVFPRYVTLSGKKCSLVCRKYCLNCSPYGAKNTVDLVKYPRSNTPGMGVCQRCKLEFPDGDFYTRPDGVRYRPYCKTCDRQRSVERQQRLKQQCVNYKGGCCSSCGYNRCLAALEFHHLDPNEKDVNFEKMRRRTFASLKPELDKCRLLCANCHREEHYGK